MSIKRTFFTLAALSALVIARMGLAGGHGSDAHGDHSSSSTHASSSHSSSRDADSPPKSSAKSKTKETPPATLHDVQPSVDPNEALVRLLEGNMRFVTGQAWHPNQFEDRRHEVAGGQHPFAAIVACADSRVPPEIVFDQGIGDLFVVRVAGNLATDEAIGSIEYAVEHLGVGLIVVMGHEKCGAVKAALDGGHAPGHIGTLIDEIEPAVARSRGKGGDPLDAAVRMNVRMVVDRLQYAEPILAERSRERIIKVVGARYDLDGGTVEFLR